MDTKWLTKSQNCINSYFIQYTNSRGLVLAHLEQKTVATVFVLFFVFLAYKKLSSVVMFFKPTWFCLFSLQLSPHPPPPQVLLPTGPPFHIQVKHLAFASTLGLFHSVHMVPHHSPGFPEHAFSLHEKVQMFLFGCYLSETGAPT